MSGSQRVEGLTWFGCEWDDQRLNMNYIVMVFKLYGLQRNQLPASSEALTASLKHKRMVNIQRSTLTANVKSRLKQMMIKQVMLQLTVEAKTLRNRGPQAR